MLTGTARLQPCNRPRKKGLELESMPGDYLFLSPELTIIAVSKA
jgi:hypothetical protein